MTNKHYPGPSCALAFGMVWQVLQPGLVQQRRRLALTCHVHNPLRTSDHLVSSTTVWLDSILIDLRWQPLRGD